MMTEQVSKNLNSRRKKSKHSGHKNWRLWVLALPAIIKIFIFSYLPMVGLLLAFENFKMGLGPLGIFKSPFVGFQNFKFFFVSQDAARVIFNTVFMNVLFIITGTVVALLLAFLLYEVSSKVLIKLFQSAIFYPYVLSWVVVGLALPAILGVNGILNSLIKSWGLDTISFYTQPQYWRLILVIAYIWKNAGFSGIVYYAVLMSIDSEYFEAAELDGASTLQKFRHVSLPFLVPAIVIFTLMAIGNIFRADFGLFYSLPQQAALLLPTTDVIDTYIYRALIYTGNIGFSTAIGLCQSVVGLVLVSVSNMIIRRIDRDMSLY